MDGIVQCLLVGVEGAAGLFWLLDGVGNEKYLWSRQREPTEVDLGRDMFFFVKLVEYKPLDTA